MKIEGKEYRTIWFEKDQQSVKIIEALYTIATHLIKCYTKL